MFSILRSEGLLASTSALRLGGRLTSSCPKRAEYRQSVPRQLRVRTFTSTVPRQTSPSRRRRPGSSLRVRVDVIDLHRAFDAADVQVAFSAVDLQVAVSRHFDHIIDPEGKADESFREFFRASLSYALSWVPTLTMPVRPMLSSSIKPVTPARSSRSASVAALSSISADISISLFYHPSTRIDPSGVPDIETVPPTPKSNWSVF